MEEQLVSFDTAILAKEKGFDIPTRLCYSENDKYGLALPYNAGNNLYRNDGEYYSAPTQSLLQRWLREKCDMWVTVLVDGITYSISIWGEHVPNEDEAFETKWFLTYEDALDFGLRHVLTLLTHQECPST